MFIPHKILAILVFHFTYMAKKHNKYNDPSESEFSYVASEEASAPHPSDYDEETSEGEYFTVACSICGKTFKTQKQLDKHMIRHQNSTILVNGVLVPAEEKKTYECPKCGKQFTRESAYEQHLQLHEGNAPLKCKYCGKVFIRESLYERHVLRHENNRDFDYECAVCGKGFNRLGSYKKHMQEHSHSAVEPN